MDIYVFANNINDYNHTINIFPNYNVKIFDNLEKDNMEYIETIKILIVYHLDEEFMEKIKTKNIVIFTNITSLNNNNCIYFENDEILHKYIDTWFNNINKSFTIIVPIYNSYEYLNKCINSILNQTHPNYKIFLCDDCSEIKIAKGNSIFEKYKNNPIFSIFKNDKNIGKYSTINKVLDKVETDYYFILDSDDTITPNRMILDLIYFGLNKEAYAVRSKYIRYNSDNVIVENDYGHISISFKSNIRNKIGMYFPNRFGSDSEYLMRIKKYLGPRTIVKYNKITYKAIVRKDNTNLTKKYNKEQRTKFIKLINKIYNNPNSLELFLQNKFDDFDKLISNVNKDQEINQINLSEYKKFYLDLEHSNESKLLKHWENIGSKEGRLFNLKVFQNKFPNFDYKSYLEYNSEIKFNTKYQVYGWVYLKNKTNYYKWLESNGYLNINKEQIQNLHTESDNLELFIQKNKIKFIYISKALEHFKSRISNKFNLEIYDSLTDKFENTIFFGLYNKDDFLKITNHMGVKYLMWGGTDSNPNYKLRNKIMNRIKEYPDISHLAISESIKSSLFQLGIKSIPIYLNLVDTNLFKPIEKKNLGNKIYIYNGFTKGNEEIYGKAIYEKVIEKLPNYEFVFSNQLSIPYEQMPLIYSECFIGLRLTTHDGNANTVQEFNSMEIPIIFNGPGGINWTEPDDIINTINKTKLSNMFKFKLEPNEYDFYNGFNIAFTNGELTNIRKNIDNFTDMLKKYKNILFICGDYPGYGGAATNCDNLQKYFDSKNFQTQAIYFNFTNDPNIKLMTNDKYQIIMQNELKDKLKKLSNSPWIPDIIILKSTVNINLKNMFKCPILYLIPGIFTNNLDKFYYQLNPDEYDKFINKNVLEQIKQSDISFSNSSHTRQILLDIYGINTELFYSSFVNINNHIIKSNTKPQSQAKTQYDFAIIVSDFNRKIKNIDSCVKCLKNKKKVILIGKNSDQYKLPNFISEGLIEQNQMNKFYSNTKFIIQNSFYESCSSVKIEGIVNGCEIISDMIEINYNDMEQLISIRKNKNYIIGNFTYFYDDSDTSNLFKTNSFESYIINQTQTKEFIIFVRLDYDLEISLRELFGKINVNNIKLGFNETIYSTDELINMYYLYGLSQIDKKLLGLSLFYSKYTNSFTNNQTKYNKELLNLIYPYFYANTVNIYNLDEIKKQINKFDTHNKNVLLISKQIKGYGGVQKTSFQLLETLGEKYNVLVLSNSLRNKVYDFSFDSLNDEIPHILILKITNVNEVENYINNSSDIKFIINNKHDEIVKFNLTKKINCICHNSMDPLNTSILENKNKIDKLFVINNFHRNLMYHNNYTNNVYTYNNYIIEQDQINKNYLVRNNLNYNIGFIGRISKEKNIQLLIDGVNYYNSQVEQKIKLYIIGDGKEVLKNLNDNIVLSGKLPFEEIEKYYKIFDYVISSSKTEGKSFSIIEALSHGIPCIHSNINGINEMIIHGTNGFVFDFDNYDEIKYDLNFNNLNKLDLNWDKNIINIYNVLKTVYSMNIDKWNYMSRKSIDLCGEEYTKTYCINKNLELFEINNELVYPKKYKIFVNFRPDDTKAYGGGNISVFYIIRKIIETYSDFVLTYELDNDINLYLIIDPFKDNNFKKYSIDDIVTHRNTINPNGKIIIRVNDCDKTRVITNINTSREHKIITNISSIDYFIFNSNFIKSYYFEKLKEKNITIDNSKCTVITNGCDENIFKNEPKQIDINKPVKILSHHWSNNINKGYETYYNLWKYGKNNKDKKIEFVFIGKNVPDMFKEVEIIGPYVREELSSEINKTHIYITDSRYDSCPNHVLEALSCGLPVLYSNCEGGARELCMMSELEVGEIYNNFDELLVKIDKIRNNYDYYRNNISQCKYLYEIKYCVNRYYNVFTKNIFKQSSLINLKYPNNILTIHSKTTNNYLLLNELNVKLIKGDNIFAINKDKYKTIELITNNENSNIEIKNDEFTNNLNKLNNDKINVLICSDSKYFVGLFAVLHSVITNTNYLKYAHFNFIIPIIDSEYFSKMLEEFELKSNVILSKSIVYLDPNIIDKTVFQSKCYNGSGHLLNLGNLSRLLIGEFFTYSKLIYLDSDSIVQTDIIKKLLNFNLESDLYAGCANLENTNNKKRIIIKMENIINCDYNWVGIIGKNIDKNENVFMGAPFLTNCAKWDKVYKKIIEIIKIHNNTEGGIYKLFTMSIQNILFYKNTQNINKVLNVLQDLGSMRKEWDKTDLIYKDILDWSGVYKPWFSNGLYKYLWDHHDIMKLSEKCGIVKGVNKNSVEKFDTTSQPIEKFIDQQYLKISDEIFNQYEKYINSMVFRVKTNVKYNILFVSDANYLLKKMSRVRFWAIEELSKYSNVKLNIMGPGFLNFDPTKTLQQNILDLNVKFDLVIWYKPLDPSYNFDPNTTLPFKTCLRYNEMWDEEWTTKEINQSKTDIIICHHFNDYLRYKNEIYKNDKNKQFYYNPHHAHPEIFKPLNVTKEYDILLSGVSKEKHYPLKYRLFNLINKYKKTTLSKYKIFTHTHPGYNNETSFQNINQIKYNEVINKSKLCIGCTSRYNYRLGKYVEIPMSGSVILGDLPYESDEFKDFVIEVNIQMTDEEILNKIINTLDDPKLIETNIKKGLEWSKKYTTTKYTDKLLKILDNDKIFIISDEIRENHPEFKNQKWICDILKQEFIDTFSFDTTSNASEAKIIWYLAPWNYRFIPNGFKANEWFEFLKTKKVIFTQHHIDEEKLKLGQLDKQFEFMKTYGTKFHGICELTRKDMLKYFDNKLISSKKLWINNKNFYNIPNKDGLRKKYNFSPNAYLVGSFQKDTEGKTNLPKLSKGPDIFVNIVKDIYLTKPNVEVILTGLRREYIITELEKAGIKYHYFNMATIEELNEFYNCLDLYIISSRCEGGPRAVFEAGITRTPIISTRVGIAPELMGRSSLFDSEKWIGYKKAKSNVELLYNNVYKLTTQDYMEQFLDYLKK